MNEPDKQKLEAGQEVVDELDKFDELPDAPPKRKLKLSWTGKIATAIVVFWMVIAVIGPFIAPFHEMDMDGDDSSLDTKHTPVSYTHLTLPTTPYV